VPLAELQFSHPEEFNTHSLPSSYQVFSLLLLVQTLMLKRPMIDLKELTTTELIDLLIKQTAKHTHFISQRDLQSQEYRECKRMLAAIQEEIDNRNPVQ